MRTSADHKGCEDVLPVHRACPEGHPAAQQAALVSQRQPKQALLHPKWLCLLAELSTCLPAILCRGQVVLCQKQAWAEASWDQQAGIPALWAKTMLERHFTGEKETCSRHSDGSGAACGRQVTLHLRAHAVLADRAAEKEISHPLIQQWHDATSRQRCPAMGSRRLDRGWSADKGPHMILCCHAHTTKGFHTRQPLAALTQVEWLIIT